MRRPSFAFLPSELARATLAVVGPLRKAGHRTYVVGGAVRDLALGIEPHDVDVASSARPEVVERLFPVAHAVGRAFGTVVVRSGVTDIQVTTFRTEGAYADARRPDHVSFGQSVEEDAARRDFTCNALYLDPVDDVVLDPTGGLEDLRAGRLRCVGDAGERFREDGLRLLRLARLAAAYSLHIEPDTLEAARAAGEALRGVSPERVRGELERIAEGAAPAEALGRLEGLGLWPRIPGLVDLAREGEPGPRARIAAVGRLGSAPGTVLLMATLLRPTGGLAPREAAGALTALRPSRALLDEVVRTWTLMGEWEACLGALRRSELSLSLAIRLAREESWRAASLCWAAWQDQGRPPEHVELEARLGALSEETLHPALWITSEELAAAGLARGPEWGRILREAEDLQLEGRLPDRAAARQWLSERVAQVGGKTRRSP
jgi:tRNA nucleotidyltransferase/poly(A) polymerase